MGLTQKKEERLIQLCHQCRVDLMRLLFRFQTGHPGGSLSAVEMITTLYEEILHVDQDHLEDPARDRFVLSKGHAAPVLYLTLARLGFFPKNDLDTFRQIDSPLQGHPAAGKTPGVELSTGPLGLGLPAALGMCLAGRAALNPYYTYVLMGDGEMQEGIVWEAAMSAAKYQASRLIVFADCNGVQLDGATQEIMPLGDIAAKWKAFGWAVYEIDGHNVQEIAEVCGRAKKEEQEKPVFILAKTVKGKGVSVMEGKSMWHGRPIDEETYRLALNDLGVSCDG